MHLPWGHFTRISDSHLYKKLGLFRLRSDDEVSLPNQPLVKPVGGMETTGCTDRPDFFIFRRFFHLFIKEQLYRAFHVIAIFPAFIIDITLYRLHN
jgi:hypothetical protein